LREENQKNILKVHLVHVKEEYNTLTEALEQPDGLAVVGIFMYIGNDGSSMANLETGLKRVVEQGKENEKFSKNNVKKYLQTQQH